MNWVGYVLGWNDQPIFRSVGGMVILNDVLYYTFESFQKREDNGEITVLLEGEQMKGLAYNSSNNTFYICEQGSHRLVVYQLDTGKVSYIGTGIEGCQNGNFYSDEVSFCYPTGITLGRRDCLFITERQKIRKINLRNGRVETVAGSMSGIFRRGFQDGAVHSAQFFVPTGIVVTDDASENDTIFVCDSWNHCIRQIKDGIVSTIVGTPTKFGYGGGKTDSTCLRFPQGLILEPSGNLIVSDCSSVWRVILNEQRMEHFCKMTDGRQMKERTCIALHKEKLLVGGPAQLWVLFDGWQVQRLFWIARMKEDSMHCNLAKLPRDLVREIIRVWWSIRYI